MDSWELLLAKALACLDSARTQGLTISEWTFGGGTALMCHFDHRFSRDIDIFVPDAAYLPYLSPRLNDAIAARTDDYDEAAHYAEPLRAAAHLLAGRRPVLLHRLSTLDQAYYRQALDELNVKPAWDFIKSAAWEVVTDFVKNIPTPAPSSSPPTP